jgi:putative PIN family toxin of toxin-antitoxin system
VSPLRVVLDSNVIISGFLFGGPPEQLLKMAMGERVRCFTSLAILDEVRDVLCRPKFGLSPNQVLLLLEEMHLLCEVVTPRVRVKQITEDPDDDVILACALASRADLIVSGDNHLLKLGRWKGVDILNPADAIQRFASVP